MGFSTSASGPKTTDTTHAATSVTVATATPRSIGATASSATATLALRSSAAFSHCTQRRDSIRPSVCTPPWTNTRRKFPRSGGSWRDRLASRPPALLRSGHSYHPARPHTHHPGAQNTSQLARQSASSPRSTSDHKHTCEDIEPRYRPYYRSPECASITGFSLGAAASWLAWVERLT
jgi:hypothetical protein